jgi:histone acetyltransferase (RNA polymerase elongator complex component)
MATVENIIDLKPDFVRIYPALVIKNTPLAHLYLSGQYQPLTLDSAIALCHKALIRFEQAGIDVIRVGLQPTEELDRRGTVLAGPYHPAFRQLVESSLLLDKMRTLLRDTNPGAGTAVFQVNPRDLSAAIGQRRSNIVDLKKEFGLNDIRIQEGNNVIRRREPTLLSVF